MLLSRCGQSVYDCHWKMIVNLMEEKVTAAKDADAVKPEKPVRILIADDHPVVREGLRAILNRQPDMEVVAEAGNSAEAVEQFLRHLPDITLLDLRMPGQDGAATVSTIRSRFPAAKIVIMSAYEGEEEVCTAILAGAQGFVPKASPREQLVGCIRQVCAGRRWIPSQIALALACRASTTDFNGTERDVLNLMAFGKSNQEIASALHVTNQTVKDCVDRILAKFGVSERTEAIAKARKHGIILRH
jgi:DNA-binding NarL/FixJ family response regulator